MLHIQENTYSEYTFSGQNIKKNSVLAIYKKNTFYRNLNINTPKFWAKYIKRKRDVSNTIYISLGKIQKFPIYRGIAINLGKV